MREWFDLIIIGAGPAGLTAALYAGRAELKALLLERAMPGGQVMTTSEVENYPGVGKISGAELCMKFQEQAEMFGTEFRYEEVRELELEEDVKVVRTYDNEYETRAILYAAGASPRPMEVPGEDRLRGRGISFCATCDGAFFRGKETAVVGGGDTAAEDALYLARMCKKVTVIVRKDKMRAAASLQRKLKELDNVEILTGTTVAEVLGDEVVEGLRIRTGNEERILPVSGVFAAIGVVPQTGLLKGKVNTCNQGYIACDSNMMTSIPGVFAAGDVVQKPLRQIITAAADGAVAVNGILNYLND